MARTTSISASSKVSVNRGGIYYTVEYSEERTVDVNDDLRSERAQLWLDVNYEVDNQIADIINSTSNKKMG